MERNHCVRFGSNVACTLATGLQQAVAFRADLLATRDPLHCALSGVAILDSGHVDGVRC